MDKILQLLQKIYKYVTNNPDKNDKGKTTVIKAEESKSSIGLQQNTLKPVTVEVSGDNTCVAYYSEDKILDTIEKKMDNEDYELTDDELIAVAIYAGATPKINILEDRAIISVENVAVKWDNFEKKFSVAQLTPSKETQRYEENSNN